HRRQDLLGLIVAQRGARSRREHRQRGSLRAAEVDVAARDASHEAELEHLEEPLRAVARIAEHPLEERIEGAEVEQRLVDVEVEPVGGEVLDLEAMRSAMRGRDVVYHVAGMVGSTPVGKVWEMNQRGPLVAVEAAALEDVPRVVVTSTISAVGTANGSPADEE